MKRKSGLADSPFFTPTPLQKSEQPVAVFPSFEKEGSTSVDESKQASLQASNIANKQVSLLAKMKDVGRLKATNAATFRFPPDLLEKLEEVEYQLRKTYKIKATKNIILVGALAMLLYEFEDKATESSLYQYLSNE